jgi:hypothetical protein
MLEFWASSKRRVVAQFQKTFVLRSLKNWNGEEMKFEKKTRNEDIEFQDRLRRSHIFIVPNKN